MNTINEYEWTAQDLNVHMYKGGEHLGSIGHYGGNALYTVLSDGTLGIVTIDEGRRPISSGEGFVDIYDVNRLALVKRKGKLKPEEVGVGITKVQLLTPETMLYQTGLWTSIVELGTGKHLVSCHRCGGWEALVEDENNVVTCSGNHIRRWTVGEKVEDRIWISVLNRSESDITGKIRSFIIADNHVLLSGDMGITINNIDSGLLVETAHGRADYACKLAEEVRRPINPLAGTFAIVCAARVFICMLTPVFRPLSYYDIPGMDRNWRHQASEQLHPVFISKAGHLVFYPGKDLKSVGLYDADKGRTICEYRFVQTVHWMDVIPGNTLLVGTSHGIVEVIRYPPWPVVRTMACVRHHYRPGNVHPGQTVPVCSMVGKRPVEREVMKAVLDVPDEIFLEEMSYLA